jgi:hypothetical protein
MGRRKPFVFQQTYPVAHEMHFTAIEVSERTSRLDGVQATDAARTLESGKRIAATSGWDWTGLVDREQVGGCHARSWGFRRRK